MLIKASRIFQKSNRGGFLSARLNWRCWPKLIKNRLNIFCNRALIIIYSIWNISEPEPFIKNMNQEEEKIEKYKVATELIKYYNDNLRRSISDFILIHTILLGFILVKAFDRSQDSHEILFLFLLSLFGFILCWFWYGNCERARCHRALRFAQAGAAEPEEWSLIAGFGKRFSEGKVVEIGGKRYCIGWLGRVIHNRDVIFLIGGFACVYLVIMFLNRSAVM